MPIEPHQVIPLPLAACPSFESVWAITRFDNLDDSHPHGRLLYLDAGEGHALQVTAEQIAAEARTDPDSLHT
jgi:hypothetical protein